MPIATQQLQALTDAVAALGQASTGLATVVQAIGTDDGLQLELDSVNARLEAVGNQIGIALAVAADPTYTTTEKIQIITETLGPQA